MRQIASCNTTSEKQKNLVVAFRSGHTSFYAIKIGTRIWITQLYSYTSSSATLCDCDNVYFLVSATTWD